MRQLLGQWSHVIIIFEKAFLDAEARINAGF
jgi:hypothetical protein